jgi:hypothetical protein
MGARKRKWNTGCMYISDTAHGWVNLRVEYAADLDLVME